MDIDVVAPLILSNLKPNVSKAAWSSVNLIFEEPESSFLSSFSFFMSALSLPESIPALVFQIPHLCLGSFHKV